MCYSRNKQFDFNWEFGNFKIRSVHESWDGVNCCYDKTTPIRKNCPIELVKYYDHNGEPHSSCYVVALFELDDEGYSLRSIGNRMFEDIDAEEIADVWKQLQAAQTMLDVYFDACRE